MAAKLRAFAVNSLIVVVSTVLCYLIIEIIFFRLLLPDMRFNVRPFLPETPGALVQTSKAGYVPHDYVAILGDSYAEGVGDEMLTTRGNEAKSFQAANVIYERTGRDVVTFGQGGAGSAEAYVRLPTRGIMGSRCLVFPTIEDPRHIFAYFYEGNDIEENRRFQRLVAARYGHDDTSALDRYLADEYGTFASWRCHFYLGDNISRIVRFLDEYYVKHTDPFTTSEKNRNTFIISQAAAAPSVLGPALAVSPQDMANAIVVFDRSIDWLRRRFPQATIDVVYIPSPLSTYRLATPRVAFLSIDDTGGYHNRETEAARVAENSNFLCNRTRDIALQHGLGFIDARPALRAAAATRTIHGPIDWLHLNHAGYQALGDFLTGRLTDVAPKDACVTPPPS